MIQDRAWNAAWNALTPLLTPADQLLLPAASWPAAGGFVTRHYEDHIDIGDATALMLHKARMGALPRAQLKEIIECWQIVHANDVFVCLARNLPETPGYRMRRHSIHLKPVHHHLSPRQWRRSARPLYFLHIPKTAGTSAWNAIAGPVASKIYYGSHHAFCAHPPGQDDYDLVGGHIFLSAIERYAAPDAAIACVLRDPVARFRSAFLHARRTDEDPATFSPAMQLMRTQPFSDFLDHPDARIEANLQLLMLGAPMGETGESVDAPAFGARIDAALANPRLLIHTTETLEALVSAAQRILGLTPNAAPLDRLNATNADRQLADIAEFDACLDRVRSLAAPERALYARVRQAH